MPTEISNVKKKIKRNESCLRISQSNIINKVLNKLIDKFKKYWIMMNILVKLKTFTKILNCSPFRNIFNFLEWT